VSEENVALLRRALVLWNRREQFELADYYHPEVEFLPLRAATEGGYYGFSGLEKFVEDTREVFDRHEINVELKDLGDRVIAWGTIRVRARGSGLDTEVPTGGVFKFRDGRIVRWEDFGSKEKALEAAGGAS
jgi:ketosteroid isomerase-like protein